MSNTSDFVIENGVLLKYVSSGQRIVDKSDQKNKSAYLENSSQTAIVVFRGYPDEIERLIDWLGEGGSPTHISDEVYEYITSKVRTPNLKLALQKFPALKAAMFAALSDSAYLLYSRSGDPFVTDYFYVGECELLLDNHGHWTHLPTEEHFKESGRDSQTGYPIDIHYWFQVKGDWEADNYVTGAEPVSITIPLGVTAIGNHAFSGCNGLTSITIPESVTAIGDHAFSGCNRLASITIPEGVTDIGDSAFMDCTDLTSITIPESVTNMGNEVFRGCSGLTNITLPAGVTSIGEYMFSGCSSLMSITLPTGVTDIGKCAFSSCKKLTHIILPESVTDIGRSAFSNCAGLGKITIPAGVTEIDNFMFESCTSLARITISFGVTRIGNNSFKNCKSLETVTIPSSVTGIGFFAFEGCTGLTSVVIPDSVGNIGDEAFKGCTNLKDVTCSSAQAKELKRYMPATEKPMILHTRDISGIGVKFRPGAAIGFAEDDRNCTDENGKKYLKYIKSNAVKLAELASEHPALFYLMLRKKLIAAKDLEAVTAVVRKSGNTELIAAISDYGNS